MAILAALVAAGSTLAAAQEAADSPPKGAADARAPVTPLVHESAFARYRAFTDASVGSWRGVNDEVARIGGWKAYAREVYEAAQRSAPVEGPATSPAPAPERRPGGATQPR